MCREVFLLQLNITGEKKIMNRDVNKDKLHVNKCIPYMVEWIGKANVMTRI